MSLFRGFYFILLFLLLFPFLSRSQDRRILIIDYPKEKEFKRILSYKSTHKDSLSAIRELKKVIITFHRNSYLLAGIDTFYCKTDTIFAKLNPGSPFRILSLKKGNADETILEKSGYREKFYQNRPFSYNDLARLEENILRYSEDHGRPFASIGLDSIEISSGNSLSAALKYSPGPEISFDSIKVFGNTKVKARFLSSWLRIFPGQPFSQEKVAAIDKQLKQLTYLRQVRPMTLVFTNDKAVIHLYLEDRKSNQADGIVGFLPNEGAGKKLLITGELNLKLTNLFGTGKNFQGEWRKFNQGSQLLNLSYYHPKIVKTNLDVKADFNLFKQDSSFLTISRNVTIFQKTGKSGRINFSGGLKSSRELISGTFTEKNTLPSFANFNYYNYGIGYEWNNLDDYFLPRKGWHFGFQSSIGNKRIFKSAGFADSLYNNIRFHSVQLNLGLFGERYFMGGKNSVFLTRVQGATLFNNNFENLFFNDLFRIGGLRSIRGFNENFFYATSYGIATVEYRFFTEESTYLFLFLDQGAVINKLNNNLPEDYPTGFGAGISFSTGAGTFSFVYSLGRSESQNFNFNLSKIHFGMISRF
jgi:outer membrane protein assembly factor BamA